MSDKNTHSVSTAFASRATGDRNAATSLPHSCPFARANDGGARIKESSKTRMGDDGEGRKTRRGRAEIAARVARLQGNQQSSNASAKSIYETTLANALNGTSRPSFWR